MTVAIYARVSTEEQVEHGTSLEEQLRLCRERAKDPIEFVDAGVSGTTMDRPQLQSLLEGVRQGRIERVVVYDPDRLSRNVTHLLLIVDELRQHRAEIEFVNFQSDLTPDGRLLFTVRGAISEFEAYRIRQRMYSGKQARARANRVASGTCIYGYRLNRVTKQWEEEPGEAQVVRLLFDWALTQGSWAIARRLNDQGVPARFGGRWQQSSVAGILRNPTYLGQMPQMEGLGYVLVPPLVARTQFDRVQAAVAARLNRPPGRSTVRYLLTGRLECGLCGRSMCGGFGRPTKIGKTTYYGCTGKVKPSDGARRCSSRLWRSDTLDAEVWRSVLEALHDPIALVDAASMEAEPEPRDWDGELAAVAQAAQQVETERDRVIRAFRRGVISEADLVQQARELDGQATILSERVAVLRQKRRAAGLDVSEPDHIQQLMFRLVEDVADLPSLAQRRAFLEALGVHVIVGPEDRVRLRLRSLPRA